MRETDVISVKNKIHKCVNRWAHWEPQLHSLQSNHMNVQPYGSSWHTKKFLLVSSLMCAQPSVWSLGISIVRPPIISHNFDQIKTETFFSSFWVECTEDWMPEGWLDTYLELKAVGSLPMFFLIIGTDLCHETIPHSTEPLSVTQSLE